MRGSESREEIEIALRCEVLSFNVESEAELGAIAECGDRAHGGTAPCHPSQSRRCRDSHKYICTGKSENKFGIGIERVSEVYARAKQMSDIKIRGVQMHIGSQITESGPFAMAVERMLPLAQKLKAAHQIEFLSVGGGIGIAYQSSLASGENEWWQDGATHRPCAHASRATPQPSHRCCAAAGLNILLEPGRLLVGNAGVLLTRVLMPQEFAGASGSSSWTPA